MQHPSWYSRRLRQMTPSEVAWRGRNAVRDTRDRIRFALGRLPSLSSPPPTTPAFPGDLPPLCAIPVGAYATAPGDATSVPGWVAAAVRQADDILSHRFTFLNLRGVFVGHPIDWNRDHEVGMATPRGYAGSIDYRDAALAGDAKVVWELNRHLHLPVLGRAYRATGNVAYAHAALEQMDSWIAQCPFSTGMNWRSPLELAIRLINWTWLLALIEPAGLVRGEQGRRLVYALDCQVQEIAGKYSRGSSANNHRIGEAAGVFVATSCCAALTDSARLRHQSLVMLCEEILAQNHPDGGNREQAFGYHLFVLHFLLIAAHVAKQTRQALPPEFVSRLGTMIDFAAAVSAAGPAPMYGDADEGYVLDLGGRDPDGRELVSIGDVLLTGAAREWSEPVAWMFGAIEAADGPRRRQGTLAPRAFPDTGLYLLQWGGREEPDSASATIDCGELGFGALAAHGHADALAMTLRAFGEDILVDPGTFDYFRYPEWREYFRSTRAHNTVTVDGLDQSVMLGPFMWGSRARTRCLEWSPEVSRARIAAEHDGYLRLADPVLHRRELTMDAGERTFVVIDRLDMAAAHQLELRFHLSERVALTRRDPHTFDITAGRGRVRLVLDSQLSVQTLSATDQPAAGWISRGYHSKEQSQALVGILAARTAVILRTVIQVFPTAC